MASTLLEETRQYHEDIERLERLIVKDFKRETKTHKEKLMQSQRVRQMLDTMQGRAEKLVEIYKDEDGARKEEIASLRGDNVFSNFYERFKDLKEYHRRFPADEFTEPENDEALLGAEPSVPFSGEEAFGRCLDLHEQHHVWINSKFGKRDQDYGSYLASLADFAAVPRAARLSRPYRQYLDSLLQYLVSFHRRTQPLGQLDRQLEQLASEVGASFDPGQWADLGGGSTANGNVDNGIGVPAGMLDLDAFESAEELEALGGDRLKDALSALGLKCGGTVRQRAERLMSVKGKAMDQVDKSMFAKGAVPAAVLSEVEARRQASTARETAVLEAKVSKLCDMLSSVIEDTKGRVEKRQAQTYEELLAEQQEAEEEAAPEDIDSEDEYVYNPLKLPLGWDGKPIPYWLYKLHGLNLEFKCEICGNASYWGRRAFERHFTEARHLAGMRALGIPNTKQFFEITTIADAMALWRTLQDRQGGGFKKEDDEEYEDAEGNVYSAKTFADLQRQGLL